MIEKFEQQYNVQVVHAWGMTEANPTGTMCRLTNEVDSLSLAEKQKIRVKQGKPVFGVNLKIINDDGEELPHDGVTMGRLMIKGLWVMRRYYKAESDAVDQDGWLDTGDIATIDPYGYMQITDRAKDLIKSGGEWISSVELENVATGHPEIILAAVIGVHDETWQERPLLIVQTVTNSNVTGQQIRDFMTGKVAKWWLPDHVEFVSEIPLTAAGKINKKALREWYRNRLA
jgi:fatty-acyl-CoA synthase